MVLLIIEDSYLVALTTHIHFECQGVSFPVTHLHLIHYTDFTSLALQHVFVVSWQVKDLAVTLAFNHFD
jgi:hypothetical protein